MVCRYSVVIPTCNRAEILRKSLERIAQLESPRDGYEVLVIDNASTDNTQEVCHAFPFVRYIYEPIPGLLAGRHRGLIEAKGDVLCFIDDDSFVDTGWLIGIEEVFGNEDTMIATGPIEPYFECLPPSWIDLFWVRNQYGSFLAELSLLRFGEEVKQICPTFVFGCNFIIRKESVYKYGGFHPDCIPQYMQMFQGDGETGLADKMKHGGERAQYCPKISIQHLVSQNRMNIEYFNKRAFYEGVSNSYTDTRAKGALVSKMGIYKQRLKTLFRSLCVQDVRDEYYIQIAKSYIKHVQLGYEFHQQHLQRDAKLLSYVFEDNYLDLNKVAEKYYNLPLSSK